MKIEDEILVNQFGQHLISRESMIDKFNTLELVKKRAFLEDLSFIITQSKPNDDDIEASIYDSKLKPSFTPCVLLRKGIAAYNLAKIINLPENELNKVFSLFLSLFRVSYQRRLNKEKGHPNKWWYWDLSNEINLINIRAMHNG